MTSQQGTHKGIKHHLLTLNYVGMAGVKYRFHKTLQYRENILETKPKTLFLNAGVWLPCGAPVSYNPPK